MVRAHHHANGGSQEERAKVDAWGILLKLIITAGQNSDIEQAEHWVAEKSCDYLIADRGYDSDAFRAKLVEKSITPVSLAEGIIIASILMWIRF
ncbi:MAG: transposase [Candidatus Symbiodolus clandestinus]